MRSSVSEAGSRNAVCASVFSFAARQKASRLPVQGAVTIWNCSLPGFSTVKLGVRAERR